MATTYITIADGSRLGNQARSAVSILQTAREQMADLKNIMETMIDGGNFQLLEQQFGLQAGQGETLYNLVAGVNTDLGTFNVSALIARLG